MRAEDIIHDVIMVEGGYVDDPLDSGGKTKYGITKKTARRYGWKGKMKNLPYEIAIDIYKRMYWKPIGGDVLLKIGGELANEVFEQAVNLGVSRAVKHLQGVLNALNDRGRLYADIHVDGVFGAETTRALFAYKEKRGEEGIRVLTAYLNAKQATFYLDLAQKREKDERFVYGWGLNRVVRKA